MYIPRVVYIYRSEGNCDLYKNFARFHRMAAGFDCDLVELPPEKIQTVCPICLLILREPRQGTCCGKIYCQTCITKVLKEDNRCPMCREPQPHFWPDKHTKQQLFGLRVFCPHRAKDGTRTTVAGWRTGLSRKTHQCDASH